MPEFLVVQTAFIGDVILATALIEKLHRFFPESPIDLLVRKGNESLFSQHPYLRQVYIWDKASGKYFNLLKKVTNIRKCRYDYLINLQRFWSTGLLAVFSNARKRIGFTENPLSFLYHFKTPYLIDRGLHEVDRNNQLIAHLTDSKAMRPALYPSPRDFEKVKEYKKCPFVCLAPASVWYTKRLPPPKWAELAVRLASDYILLFIGAPEDRKLCDEIMDKLPEKRAVNLCGQLSLLQSTALIKDAKMSYVNDSAPLHLASSVNAPTTAFFCSTVAEFGFGPLSENAKVAQIDEDLSCRPCGIHGRKICPQGHFRCGHDIDVTKYLP